MLLILIFLIKCQIKVHTQIKIVSIVDLEVFYNSIIKLVSASKPLKIACLEFNTYNESSSFSKSNIYSLIILIILVIIMFFQATLKY